MKRFSIGIVGYGDFTKLMLEHLAPYADIVVSSRTHTDGDAGFGAQFAPLSDVLDRPIIIPSIPSQFFESFFTEHAAKVNPDATVIDVCSVKVKPLEVLERLLPETCHIIGTHPLLGPASVEKNQGLRGLRCVVSRVRASDEAYSTLESFLAKELGLKILEKTPSEHDKTMAYVQGLSHYIGRVMQVMDIPETELSTFAYDDLLDMKRIQGGDSWELFESIMHENPYAFEVNQGFKQAMTELDKKISAG